MNRLFFATHGDVFALSSEKDCVPLCRFFRCGQRALADRGRQVWCRWVNDVCTGGRCKYAACAQRKMLANGKCGVFVKRRTVGELTPEGPLAKAVFGARARRKLEDLGI